jgi:hypothetical protein
MKSIIILAIISLFSWVHSTPVSTEYFYWEIYCDESEEIPRDGKRDDIIHYSSVFSCVDCDYTNNYDGAIDRMQNKIRIKYPKSWRGCAVNSHALKGPFASKQEAEDDRLESIATERNNNHKIIYL